MYLDLRNPEFGDTQVIKLRNATEETPAGSTILPCAIQQIGVKRYSFDIRALSFAKAISLRNALRSTYGNEISFDKSYTETPDEVAGYIVSQSIQLRWQSRGCTWAVNFEFEETALATLD